MTLATVLVDLVQVLLFAALAPVLIGVTRQVRARLEGRAGAGIWQPWRDIRKLLVKQPVRAPGSSWILRVAPLVLTISSLVLAALLPLVSTVAGRLIPGDLFVVVSVLLIGAVALALVGLDAGTAFGGMGSSRHMTVLALVEPTLLLAIYALSIPSGSSNLAIIVDSRLANPSIIVSPVGLLAMAAFIIAVAAETGRLPVDNPSTHLELTMMHEAMLLESTARDLGWLEFGSWLKLTVLLGLIGNLLIPWGVATTTDPMQVVVGVPAVILKVLVLGGMLSVGEVLLAKVRLFRVPELLAGSFVLAFLAVAVSAMVP
ncbi:respiratory chain complex I subunit 1 family protein [Lacisediminihabitans profunda]|uniref:Formate hydrogenlyase n=1 Tax=Lacisediminihabitans profunda TaxID=2594790 RepID=A0A5C8UKW0_9MICO|nr:NADH-quinone oxidoreductase subunit H [Lacisediminihabitans profunda]TXN28928.1 formate hydrogenlyase [Lacisediminihabitans profunda]